MTEVDTCKLLSIQSTVVYGYVGNKSATFPLQVLGFDVSTINSVQFSNHCGYKTFKGQVLHAEEVSDLYEGLKLNNLHHFSHLLTGYIGSSSFLEKVHEIIQELKQCNPGLIFGYFYMHFSCFKLDIEAYQAMGENFSLYSTTSCDPVMGDNGKMYVKPELLPVYRDKVVPLADIVTPNQFEAELLTGMKISSEEEALLAMEKLHERGTNTVVLSSTDLGADNSLLCLSSSVRNGSRECYRLQFPLLPAYFTGTGDLFAALLLAWLHKDNDLKLALEKTVASVQAVLKRTLDFAKRKTEGDDKPAMHLMELRLVQSKHDFENPTIVYHATKI